MTLLAFFWYESPSKDFRKKIEKKLSILYPNFLIDPIKTKEFDLWILCEKSFSFPIFKNDKRVLIGKCFKKSNYQPISPHELDSLNAEDLVKKNFGNYLFFDLSQNSTCKIFKDPTGQIPLFYLEDPGKFCVASTEISLMLEVLDKAVSWNWPYLTNFLLYGQPTSIQSSFENVFELLCGSVLEISHQKTKQSVLWNARDYILPGKNISSKQIVHTLTNTLKCLVGSSKKAFIEFSGGLDSSAILFCLKSFVPTQNLAALNIFDSQIASSNELIHARKIAKEVGVYLEEIDSNDILPISVSKPLLCKPNRPSALFSYVDMEQAILNFAKKDSSACFISGQGGDELFMCPPSLGSMADVLLDKQFSSIFPKAVELAMYYQIPIYPIFSNLLKGMFSYLTTLPYRGWVFSENIYKTPWFKKKLLKMAGAKEVHPIVKNLKFFPPGKSQQITGIFKALSEIQQDIIPWTSARIYPLLSQPMIELALQIPSYALYGNGYDRYPLRKAISTIFHTQSVFRKDKGETSGVFQKGLLKNKKRALELCLEGYLAKKDLVDKNQLALSIDKLILGNKDYLWPLTHLLSLEIFLSSWKK